MDARPYLGNSDVDLDKLAEAIVENAIETSKSIDDDILYKKKGTGNLV